MFEVNLFTPAQFGAFIPWLAIWRGPLSALVHPNTVEPGLHSANELRNHTARATWMGEKVPLDVSMFYKLKQQEMEERQKKAAGENGGA
jgi:DOPA 4,5-dioxygenase